MMVIYRSPFWGGVYPNSIAEDRTGTIYLGMRSAVARLSPRSGGFFEDWLVPSNCTQRQIDPSVPFALECRCIPAPAVTPAG